MHLLAEPGPWHNGGGGHPLAWAFFVLFLIVGVIAAVVLILGLRDRRREDGAPPTPSAAADPLEVLRLRYARGEVGRDEFLQASADLGGPSAVPAGEAPAGGAPSGEAPTQAS